MGDTRTQPIAIEDVIACLVAARTAAAITGSRIVEIGGPDRVSYGELMREYARQRGLRRAMIRVPALTPRLSSLWLGLVTPVYARVGRELVEGLRNETVVRDPAAQHDLLGVRPRGVHDAIARALVNEDRDFAATRWSDALSSGPAPRHWGTAVGSRLIDSRVERVPVPPAVAFAPIRRIGGRRGWYYGDALWRLRGMLDLPFGGAGMRRGRRDPERLLPGDTVRLMARRGDRAGPPAAPGRRDAPPRPRVAPVRGRAGRRRRSVIRQTAVFDPAGILGRRTGTPSRPSTASSSAAWSAASPGRPPRRARAHRGGPRVSAPASGLADRLVDWMAANRSSLDELMAQEGSRAIHEEFILAEGGTLPDRSARIARARTASARAWMRHLAQAVAAELPGTPPDLADRLTVWMNGNGSASRRWSSRSRRRWSAAAHRATRRRTGATPSWPRPPGCSPRGTRRPPTRWTARASRPPTSAGASPHGRAPPRAPPRGGARGRRGRGAAAPAGRR